MAGLARFLAAVHIAANTYAPQYGLTPAELERAMIATAAVEGGLGEEAGVGDGGASVGRYQFHTAGGHGATLLQQGYTREQIADDAFQADHWAPILAQELASAKKQGYSGAEAARIAAYRAERPAQIYDSGRFSSAYDQANGLATNPATGGEVTGASAMQDAYDPNEYKRLVDEARQAILNYNAADPGDPKASAKASLAMEDAIAAVEGYRTLYGIDPRKDGAGAAGDAIDRWATIEGVDIQRAQQAFNTWKEKSGQAFDAARSSIEVAQDDNAKAVDLQEARNQSSTPGLLPRNLKAGTHVPKFEDALKRFRDMYGVSSSPPPLSGYATPPGESTSSGFSPQLRASGDPSLKPLGYQPGGLTPSDPSFKPEGYGPGSWADDPSFKPEGYGPAAPEDDSPDGALAKALGLAGRTAIAPLLPGMMLSRPTTNAAKKVGRWFSRRFAEGGTNIPGGPGLVGEKGPELMYHPSFGVRVIGRNGPEQMDIPDGASIIPMNEAMAFRDLQGAMNTPPADEAAARMNDPDKEAKVMESIRRAMASSYALNPPTTPVPYGGARDLYAEWRGLTGIPAQQQEVM